MKRFILITLSVVLLSAVACKGFLETELPTEPTPTPADAIPLATFTPTITPTPTFTPTPTPSPTPQIFSGRLVYLGIKEVGTDSSADVIVHDGNDSMKVVASVKKSLSAPAISPDGAKISFIDGVLGTSYLYVMNVDGSGKKIISSNFENVSSSAWSPNGTKIAYISSALDSYTSYVHIRNVDGADETIVAKGNGVSWSPDSSKLLIVDAGVLYIHTLSTNTSTRIAQSYNNKWFYHSEAAWAPDGSTIAFVSHFSDGNPNQLYTANVDGTNISPVLPINGLIAINFTSDSQGFVFCQSIYNSYFIFKSDLAGLNKKQLTYNSYKFGGFGKAFISH